MRLVIASSPHSSRRLYALVRALALSLLIAVPTHARAQAEPPMFAFATIEQGRALLGERDEYTRRMGAFDRAARLKTDAEVPEDAYLRFAADAVREWTPQEKAAISAALRELAPRLVAPAAQWPATIHLVKTTGREEGGASYTRGAAMVLATPSLRSDGNTSAGLQHLIAHELFHVLSRHNPALRQKLYGVIGFVPCGEPVLPPALRPLIVTNPDAPVNEYCIRVRAAGAPVWAMPLLVSRAARYNAARGGEFFGYLEVKFLLKDAADGTPATEAPFDPAQPRLVEVGALEGFAEQAGDNTVTLPHPEEILAENFALLVTGAPAKTPRVIAGMRDVLGETAPPGPR